MRLEWSQLQRVASEYGFAAEPFEKILQLVDLLEALRAHPYLTDRLVLKGGTALNLFLSDLPRLSLDIDLNHIGAVDRDTMRSERPLIEQAVRAVCGRQGIEVRHSPADHAGAKWRLSYQRTQGGSGKLELDLNFLLRSPLWAPVKRDSPAFLGIAAKRVPVVDLHELVAGKLAALFSRCASRDLYDVSEVLARDDLDLDKLRVGFVAYGAMSRRDWRTVSPSDVAMSPRDAKDRLLPLLRLEHRPARENVAGWCESRVVLVQELLAKVLPLLPNEQEFLDGVNDRGVILPELLSEDSGMQRVLANHPALLWKVQNVRQFRSRSR